MDISRRAVVKGVGATVVMVPIIGFAQSGEDAETAPGRARSTSADSAAEPGPLLFVDLHTARFPDTTTQIATAGWSVSGVGAGQYVSDDLARKLYLVHPRFCRKDASGRAWRLLPEDGMILVEQGGALGDAAGDASNNDRIPFQTAIAYAGAIGVELIGLPQPSYAVWVGERTSDVPVMNVGPARLANRADGHGLVIPVGQKVHFRGLGAERSTLRFRSVDGTSFASTDSNFQVINGKLWRGGGIFVLCDRKRNAPRTGLTVENLLLDGGFRRDTRTQNENDLAWDITHRGIWCQVNRPVGADITILDSEMIGWRGETVYTSNQVKATTTVMRSKFSHSNGQGLNPKATRVNFEDVLISNCFMGIEGWTGAAGGRIVRTVIEDITHKAFKLQGGMQGRSDRSIYNVPTPTTPGEVPIGTIDITCRRAGTADIGWWIHGKLKLVDTRLVFGDPYAYGEGSQLDDLDIVLRNETADISHIVIAGGKGEPGDMLTDKLDLRVVIDDAFPSKKTPVVWAGSLGPDIRVSVTGSETRQPPRAVAAAPDYSPVFA